ncbi:MAG TPA: DUF1206 domain-containing protein [Stellaceae bacterium]|nr:DUF1206 domain-containing protein [Stellaceae bacterium]
MTTLSLPSRQIMTILARVGFATRGLIYLLIGGFATGAAFRSNQSPQGFTGAAQAVLHKPFGSLVVVGIVIGLGCFVGWLAVEAVIHGSRRREPRHWLLAIGRFGDALLYAGFMFLLLGLLLGRRAGGEHGLHSWVAWLFSSPGGRWLVGLVGIGLFCAGIGLVVWAWAGNVAAPLDLAPKEKRMTNPVSRYGVSGRGVALALIGFYLVSAAFDANPAEAHELGGLLQHLRHTAYGWIILLLFALSFGASAFFDFLAAFYRHIEAPA